MRTLTLSDDEIEMVVEAIEELCQAIATDYDLLEDEEGESDAEPSAAVGAEEELDPEQEEALDAVQRLVELREKILRQAALGGGSFSADE